MVKKEDTIKRILNCIPSKNTEKDWTFEHAAEAGIMSAAPSVPSSKDLREAWWNIGDQLNTGSCVGWATADAVLRWHFVKANRLPKDKRLSVRYIWMAAKETDEFTSSATTFIESVGTSPKAALDISRKFGVVQESVLTFEPPNLYSGDVNSFYALAAQLKIASYFNLRPKSTVWNTCVDNWRTWLATKGPILTGLGVDATWENATETKGKLDVYKPKTVSGGHAVAIVGYTPDRFIIRNSWGTEWGDKGFAYASLAYAQAAFQEAYGVAL
ncbi:MAG: C1 family peptidase [Candidatus Methanoperedens sp.]|nr:C1 family peptidase [Candidatus Methanoperedens sp.]